MENAFSFKDLKKYIMLKQWEHACNDKHDKHTTRKINMSRSQINITKMSKLSMCCEHLT